MYMNKNVLNLIHYYMQAPINIPLHIVERLLYESTYIDEYMTHSINNFSVKSTYAKTPSV